MTLLVQWRASKKPDELDRWVHSQSFSPDKKNHLILDRVNYHNADLPTHMILLCDTIFTLNLHRKFLQLFLKNFGQNWEYSRLYIIKYILCHKIINGKYEWHLRWSLRTYKSIQITFHDFFIPHYQKFRKSEYLRQNISLLRLERPPVFTFNFNGSLVPTTVVLSAIRQQNNQCNKVHCLWRKIKIFTGKGGKAPCLSALDSLILRFSLKSPVFGE